MTDVMERLFPPDAMSPAKTARALHDGVQQTKVEVWVQIQLVVADLGADDEDDDEDED